MAGLAYDPQNLTFVANGRSYMLVRHFKAPAKAALPHLDPADAARIVRAAARADPGLAQKFNRAFSHNVGNVHRFDGRSTPVADAILQIQRKEMYLLGLGPAATIPKDVVAAAGGTVRAHNAVGAGALARAGHGAGASSIPRDPIDRLVLVIQGIGDLSARDVGPKLWEKIEGLTKGRTVAALTTAMTAFVMAQLTGPAALILDSVLLGYGLYSLGTGIFQFADDLHTTWDRIKTARTREDLKALSIALAVLLAGFAIERVISLLARGGARKGSGINNEAGAKRQVAPTPTNKPAPVPGKAAAPGAQPAPKPKTGETASTASGKAVHAREAADRRARGDFDLVNEPLTDAKGAPIKVPKRVDLNTGQPLDGRTQISRPDAVRFKDHLIVDDKPLGRPIAKDRQEIIRFMDAYQKSQGKLPDRIAIQRYDPITGKPVVTDLFKPEDFLPGGK